MHKELQSEHHLLKSGGINMILKTMTRLIDCAVKECWSGAIKTSTVENQQARFSCDVSLFSFIFAFSHYRSSMKTKRI
jgi:hypothetical protein